jgi:hypothetical protein
MHFDCKYFSFCFRKINRHTFTAKKMSSRSYNRTCVICQRTGNHCKRISSVESDSLLSKLVACYPDKNIVPKVDVCSTCKDKAKWKNTKIIISDNNENSLNAEFGFFSLGIFFFYSILVSLK